MRKIKRFLIFSVILLVLINNLFLFTLANKYSNVDRLIKPTIVLKKNKYGNSEGITLKPNLIFYKSLSSKTQTNFKKLYMFLNFVLIISFIYKKKELDYYGTAKFADREDIEKMNITKHEDDGVVLGMTKDNEIITHNGVEHLMNMAPTRTGKGINTVLPTLWTWKSSVVVNDIKGECWDLTSGFRRSILKQKCIFFNPMDETGEGISYNPLTLVKVGTRAEQEDARTIAITVLDTEGKGESDHWISSAINLLTAVILHVKYVNINASFLDVMRFLEDPKEPLVNKIGDVIAKELNDMGDVVDKVKQDSSGNKIKIDPFNHYESLKSQTDNIMTFKELYMQDTTLHPIVGSTFATMFATPDKERGSIFSTCINKLAIFKDPRVMRNVQRADITPKEIMNNRISLYLITPPKAIDMTRPLFRLIITQTIYELTDKMEFNNRKKIAKEKKNSLFDLKKIKEKINNFFYKQEEDLSKLKNKRILLLIDEFPALGKLGLFEKALAYIAGYGLKVLLIVQSINQLNNIYGKDNSILDNCNGQLYFTPNDKETPKMISDMMGNKTERIVTRSGRGIMMENRSESFQARPLMTPGEVRVLPYESILLLLSGKNPILGKKIFWFKHKKYKTNADYNIPYPSYLRLLKEIEENGGDEYVLEYLIYLKRSYKALKVIVSKIGEKSFVVNILKNKEIEDEISKLNEEELEKTKKDILTKELNKNKYTEEEYQKEFNEYLQDLAKEDVIKYLKSKYYKQLSNSKLEKIIEENLKEIEKNISPEEQLEMKLIGYLKDIPMPDSWLPVIPKTFIEQVLELEKDDKEIFSKTVDILDDYIEKDKETNEVKNVDFNFYEVQEILLGKRARRKRESNELIEPEEL